MPILETLAIGAYIGGTLMNAIGSIFEGNSQKKAAEYQAMSAEQDSYRADWNANLVLGKAKDEERRYRVMARREMGSLVSGMAASGLTGGEEILAEAASVFEHDAQKIRAQGGVEASAYRSEGTRKREYAKQLRVSGKNAQIGGYVGAGATILGGAGKVIERIKS